VIEAMAMDAYEEYLRDTKSQAGKLEGKLQEVLAEQASLTELKSGRYISHEAYTKEVGRLSAELKRVDDAMRKSGSENGTGYEAHIDKVEVGDGILAFHFIDGQIIERRSTLCSH